MQPSLTPTQSMHKLYNCQNDHILKIFLWGFSDLANYYAYREKHINSKKSKVPKSSSLFFFLNSSTGLGSLGVTKGLMVKVVFSMTWTNTLEVGDVASKLLDGLNLLMQEVTLDEVRHLNE